MLYDLSAMAAVVENPANYTGVQRVAHEVAAGLARDPRVHLSLYGGRRLRAAERFACTDARLAECKFLRGPLSRISSQVADFIAPKNAATTSQQPPSRSVAKLNLLRRRGSAFVRWFEGKVDHRQLASHRVYHSPVYGFPPEVRWLGRGLRRFLTIYDLSPVKLPEHTIKPIMAEFRAMVRTVRSDRDYFLCISQSTKDDWCEYTGSDPARCFVTPLAAPAHFAPCTDAARIAAIRLRCGLPAGARYFMGLSTVEPRKNIGTVIKAFFDLLKQTRRDDLYLLLVGRQGWKTDSILEAAGVNPNLRSRVIFTGYMEEADLAPLLTDALAFVYLSFYEGFGLPPLEAMQCGAPVVTSNVSSLPEVIGSAGVLLAPTDHDGLSAALLRLADDDQYRQGLRASSLRQAKEFTWQRCVDATISAYHHALQAS